MSVIAENLAVLRAQIDESARQAGRLPDGIMLLAVSKTHNADVITEALLAGQRHFGENRVQQAQVKFPALKVRYPDLRLHLVGALQSNKAAAAVALFDVIETLDRPKLAEILAAEMQGQQRRPDILIEINLGAEPQKAGILPESLPDFLHRCREEWGLPVRGLMGIPPQHENPAPHFHNLSRLADRHNLPERSMGMSADYRTAIACGATEIRIGTAIFGKRRR